MGQFMALCDDDDETSLELELDEFDLWEAAKSPASLSQNDSPESCRSADHAQTIHSFQRLFLDELKDESDINGAAAKSLKKSSLCVPNRLQVRLSHPTTN